MNTQMTYAYVCPIFIQPITMNPTNAEIRELELRLKALEVEHRDLDAATTHMAETNFPDQLTLLRLKKRKLVLKDEITKLGMRLVPDIPA